MTQVYHTETVFCEIQKAISLLMYTKKECHLMHVKLDPFLVTKRQE